MTPRNSKEESSKATPRRRRKDDIEPTTPKSYILPFNVILELRQLAREYGSQGRALQVGSEILTRMRKPPAVDRPDPDTLMRMTYKLPPRTIRVIGDLAQSQYEDEAQAIAASLKTLKMKKIE